MKDRLRYIIKSKGLTQTQFAEKIGQTQNSITNYVTGRRSPSASVINNICKTFSVNEDWLVNGVGEPFVELEEDAELAEWCSRVLTDEDYETQKRIIQFIKRLDQADIEAVKRVFAIGNQILNEFSNEK